MTCPRSWKRSAKPKTTGKKENRRETFISVDLIDPHCSYTLLFRKRLFPSSRPSFIITKKNEKEKVPPHVATAAAVKRLSLVPTASDSPYSPMTERLRILLTSSWMMNEIYPNSAQIYMNHFWRDK